MMRTIFNYSKLTPKYLKPKFKPSHRCVLLSYRIFGENIIDPEEPPILIFHELLNCKRIWYSIGKTMRTVTKRIIVCVDLRNHGKSPYGSPHTYSEMAKDVAELYTKLKFKKALLLGHGMGGRVAMYVALTKPELVSGLLIEEASPISTPIEFQNYIEVLHSLKKIKLPQKKLIIVRKEIEPDLEKLTTNKDLVKNLLENITNRNGKVEWSYNIEVLIEDFEQIAVFPRKSKELRPFYGLTLFIGGQWSDYIPLSIDILSRPDDLPHILGLFPRSLIKYVPKSKHNPHLNDPKSFLEMAIKFIRAHNI